jgi:hypothetical protein
LAAGSVSNALTATFIYDSVPLNANRRKAYLKRTGVAVFRFINSHHPTIDLSTSPLVACLAAELMDKWLLEINGQRKIGFTIPSIVGVSGCLNNQIFLGTNHV